jgi:predicted nucleotidyltransferase component of viral defense system
LHVDLAYDAVTLPSEATSLGPALARDELAGSKLLALFGRGEPRDFLDVRNLLEHYSTDELVALAERFDAGFDRRVLAEMLGRVTRLPRNAFAASDDEYDESVRLFTMWQRNLNEAEDG